jgi:cytochrome c5
VFFTYGAESKDFIVGNLAPLAALAGMAVAFAGEPVRLPDGPGKKILEAACVSCHGLDVVISKKLSKQRWEVLVLGMTDERVPLSKAAQAELVEYLAANFGEKDRGKELVEEICSLCHEWQRVQTQHLTKDEWAGVIKGMIFEGAPVTDGEFDQIVNYLAKTYGGTKE